MSVLNIVSTKERKATTHIYKDPVREGWILILANEISANTIYSSTSKRMSSGKKFP